MHERKYINYAGYGQEKTRENIGKIDIFGYGKRRKNNGTINKTDEIRVKGNCGRVRPRKKWVDVIGKVLGGRDEKWLGISEERLLDS